MTRRPITDDERALMTHVSRFGSDGYPIRKLKRSRGWIWDDFGTVKGAPVVYTTKREAFAAFERFVDVLIEALGEEARERALAEQKEREQARKG